MLSQKCFALNYQAAFNCIWGINGLKILILVDYISILILSHKHMAPYKEPVPLLLAIGLLSVIAQEIRAVSSCPAFTQASGTR